MQQRSNAGRRVLADLAGFDGSSKILERFDIRLAVDDENKRIAFGQSKKRKPASVTSRSVDLA